MRRNFKGTRQIEKYRDRAQKVGLDRCSLVTSIRKAGILELWNLNDVCVFNKAIWQMFIYAWLFYVSYEFTNSSELRKKKALRNNLMTTFWTVFNTFETVTRKYRNKNKVLSVTKNFQANLFEMRWKSPIPTLFSEYSDVFNFIHVIYIFSAYRSIAKEREI